MDALRYIWFIYVRAVKARLFGIAKDTHRRLPRKGDQVLACCPNEQIKTVEYVSALRDEIVYTDGTSDSIFHCGWQPLQYPN